MSVEEKLDELIKQIKTDHEQADKGRYENLMYIFWGFALATLGLAAARITTASTVISGIVTFAFFVLGWIEFFRAYKPKAQ